MAAETTRFRPPEVPLEESAWSDYWRDQGWQNNLSVIKAQKEAYLAGWRTGYDEGSHNSASDESDITPITPFDGE